MFSGIASHLVSNNARGNAADENARLERVGEVIEREQATPSAAGPLYDQARVIVNGVLGYNLVPAEVPSKQPSVSEQAQIFGLVRGLRPPTSPAARGQAQRQQAGWEQLVAYNLQAHAAKNPARRMAGQGVPQGRRQADQAPRD